MPAKKTDNKKALRNFVREGRFKLDSLAYRHMDTVLMDRDTLEAAVEHIERMLRARSTAGIAARGKSGRKITNTSPEAEANRRRVRKFYEKRKSAAV
jgi:DNA invertase Pin-like site-specific DNA recombinase